jgi:hypothetical protein
VTEPAKATTMQVVREALAREWRTPAELQKIVLRKQSVMVSDAAITARIRDLRKAKYGGMEVLCRPRAGRHSFEYKLQIQTRLPF